MRSWVCVCQSMEKCSIAFVTLSARADHYYHRARQYYFWAFFFPVLLLRLHFFFFPFSFLTATSIFISYPPPRLVLLLHPLRPVVLAAPTVTCY